MSVLSYLSYRPSPQEDKHTDRPDDSEQCVICICNRHLDYFMVGFLITRVYPKHVSSSIPLVVIATDKEHTLWYTGCACRHSST